MSNKITVTSVGTSANVNVTPDTAMFYSNKSMEWAISGKLIDGKDYSSKYYANVSAQNAQVCRNTRAILQSEYNQYSQELEELATENLAELNTVAGKVQADTNAIVNKGKSELNNALNTLEDNIEESIKEIEGSTLLDTKVDKNDMVILPIFTKTEADNAYVNITGDTMTGDLTIVKAQGRFIIKEPNLDYTTIPSSESISSFRLSDKNNYALGDVRFIRTTSGEQTTTLYARNKINGTDNATTVIAGVSATGNRYVNLNTDVINVNNEVMPYIKSRVVSGTSYYETWSDGWIRQGGVIIMAGDSIATVTLLQNYSNTNYGLNTCLRSDFNANGDAGINAVPFDNTSFRIKNGAQGSEFAVTWEAWGK